MTAAELARRSGVSKQTISDWTAGIQPRSIPQVKKIADVFGVSLDSLLFGQETKASSHSYSNSTLLYSKSVPDFKGHPQTKQTSNPKILFSIGHDGFLRSPSSSLSASLGWTEKELTGRPFIEFIHLSDRDRTYLRMIKHAYRQSDSYSLDSRYLCKNGEIKWMRWSSISVEDELILVTCRDVKAYFILSNLKARCRSRSITW